MVNNYMTSNDQKYLDSTKKIVFNHIDKDKYAVFLYGSRANGKSWKHSDIDVGIIGNEPVPVRKMSEIFSDIEEADMPYNVDVVDFRLIDDEFKRYALSKIQIWNIPNELRDTISETNDFVYGPKELYCRRIEYYRKALVDFKKLMDIDLSLFDNKVVIDGLKNGQIQKFEICAELMWKTIKRLLESKENIKVKSANSTMNRFYMEEDINGEELTQILEDKNLLSHEYSESYFEGVHSRLNKHIKNMIEVLKILEKHYYEHVFIN